MTEESYVDDEWVDDEAEDAFHEEMWETINNTQASLIGECLEAIKRDQEEQIKNENWQTYCN